MYILLYFTVYGVFINNADFKYDGLFFAKGMDEIEQIDALLQ